MVQLYRAAGEVDDLPFTLVCCESGRWLNDAGTDYPNDLPAKMPVHLARQIIRNSWYPSSSYHVEYAR